MTQIKLTNSGETQSIGITQQEGVQGVTVSQDDGAQTLTVTQADDVQTLSVEQADNTQTLALEQNDEVQSLSVEQADEVQEIPVSPDVKFLRGEDGATFTPHVDEDGNLSWTNDGGFENPETVNIKGPQGDGYVLTDEDREEIAGLVPAPEIPDFTETDPTVPDWAKKATKPSYTADEVGADSKGSADSALTQAKAYADQQIAAIPTPDVSGQIGQHNVSTDAHNDLRLLIEDLTARLTALADSDDDTLDQLSEVVSYIKANRELIESVTTAKVNVSDIIDNLTTNVANKPLSAAQGVALKQMVDAIEIPTVPTKVSAFENDAGYLTQHQDVSGKLDKSVLADYIVEQGTSGMWTYRKWNSGIAEVWGKHSVATTIAITWGNAYRSEDVGSKAYPFAFKEPPVVSVACVDNQSAGVGDIVCVLTSKHIATTSPCVILARFAILEKEITFNISTRAIGRWK